MKTLALSSICTHIANLVLLIISVEMFLLGDGSILLNEVAPRPHNSGHYTMDGCVTSQVNISERCQRRSISHSFDYHVLHLICML